MSSMKRLFRRTDYYRAQLRPEFGINSFGFGIALGGWLLELLT